MIPRPRPNDDAAVPGTVYPLHFDARLAAYLQGTESALVRAAVAGGADVAFVATFAGTRALERRLKRWHKTVQFFRTCRRDTLQAAR